MIFYLIVTLIVLIIIFLLIREINCWYWKINERANLQRRTNLLLEKIYLQNGGKLDDIKDGTFVDSKNKINEEIQSTEGLVNDAYNQLSDKEKNEINGFIQFGIKKGNKIAIHKFSKKQNDSINKNGII